MIVTIDFETMWNQDYTLTKMSETAYILDPRFEVILCGIKLGDAPTRVYRGVAQVAEAFKQIDWDRTALLSHNARFDAAILLWRFGHMPAMFLDTLSMARGWVNAYTGSVSLANVARHYQLAPKGDAAIRYKGRWFASFTPAELDDYASYCSHDTDLCRALFDRMLGEGFPKAELRTIDLGLRKFAEPQAKLLQLRLAENLAEEVAKRETALAQIADIPKTVFASNPQFAALLANEGVEVPMKASPATGEMVPALARNDPDFRALCEDPEQTPRVQAMLAARLNTKSTIGETRALKMLQLSRAPWRDVGRTAAWMPVPYNYYGAHTGRFSGTGGFNFANLVRGGALRDAISAPTPDYRVVHRDSSQIEARIVAWMAGNDHLLAGFADGTDLYAEFASLIYDRPITTADKPERFTGKTCILSLGYGSGWRKLQATLYIGQGGLSVRLDETQAQNVVQLYRQTYAEIPALWKTGEVVLNRLIGITPTGTENTKLPVVTEAIERLVLPNGMSLRYPGISQDFNTPDGRPKITYDVPPSGKKKIYGAKLIENVTQALARIIITDVEIRVWKETGHRPFMSTYDSHDYIVPTAEVEAFDKTLEQAFAVVPHWAPGLPLASEGGWGRTLLQAEIHTNE